MEDMGRLLRQHFGDDYVPPLGEVAAPQRVGPAHFQLDVRGRRYEILDDDGARFLRDGEPFRVQDAVTRDTVPPGARSVEAALPIWWDAALADAAKLDGPQGPKHSWEGSGIDAMVERSSLDIVRCTDEQATIREIDEHHGGLARWIQHWIETPVKIRVTAADIPGGVIACRNLHSDDGSRYTAGPEQFVPLEALSQPVESAMRVFADGPTITEADGSSVCTEELDAEMVERPDGRYWVVAFADTPMRVVVPRDLDCWVTFYQDRDGADVLFGVQPVERRLPDLRRDLFFRRRWADLADDAPPLPESELRRRVEEYERRVDERVRAERARKEDGR